MTQSTPVLILCGGMGTRLREETEYRPKPMVEIGGRPILWHIMRIYAAHGYRRFVLLAGYRASQIKEYFLNYEALRRDFTITLGKHHEIEFHDLHGDEEWQVTIADTGVTTMTGGRVKKAARYIDADRFMLTYGDGVADIDITALMKAHVASGRVGTVTGVRPPSRYGELDVDGDRVTSFAEKPQLHEGLINGGFFVFERQFLDYLTDDPGCVLEQKPLEALTQAGQLGVFRHPGFWQCMDTYRDSQMLNQMWNDGQAPWRK